MSGISHHIKFVIEPKKIKPLLASEMIDYG